MSPEVNDETTPTSQPAKQSPLDLQDFLDATADASRRAHNLMLLLTASCILLVMGIVNSTTLSWPRVRFEAISTPESEYSKAFFEHFSGTPEQNEAYKATVRSSFLRGLIDNVYYLKLPLINYGFDINDLSLVGGLGISIVLILLRYSIRAESNSLRIAFKASHELGTENEQRLFYEILAIKQVFTTPYLAAGNWNTRRRWHVWLFPKLIHVIPSFLLLLIFLNDAWSYSDVAKWAPRRAEWVLVFGAIGVVLSLILGASCWRESVRVDKLWDAEWLNLQESVTFDLRRSKSQMLGPTKN